MSGEQTPETIDVRVTYSPLEGCTLKAISLARDIERCFELPVQISERQDGIFEVLVNQKSIYRKTGVCENTDDHQDIFSEIGKFKKPVRNPEIYLPDPERENDPDYQRWLGSVCSGE